MCSRPSLEPAFGSASRLLYTHCGLHGRGADPEHAGGTVEYIPTDLGMPPLAGGHG